MSYDNFCDFDCTSQETIVIEQMIHQILHMKQEIQELNQTIQWLHSAIWKELAETQTLTEEIQLLRKILNYDTKAFQ